MPKIFEMKQKSAYDLLKCKLGDELRIGRQAGWIVKGVNTLNGDLYLERSNHDLTTVTMNTAHKWEKVRKDA